MTGVLEQTELAELNEQFEGAEPQKIVRWAAARFGSDLAMSSSFGVHSAVLLHMAAAVAPDIKIIFIDTGYIFPETHLFMELLRRRLDLNVWVYRTRNDPIDYLHRHGEGDATWRKDINACCAANKNEPFERAMAELSPQGWLRGIRRHQSATRRDRRFIEWSDRYRCHAVSPLLNWTGREMHAYMKTHDLPYHPLFEKGYASIGCNPLSCTRPIGVEEDRAGRWAGQNKVECGINLTNSLDSANL